MRWLWVLQTAQGENLSVLSGATDRDLTYKRSQPPRATGKIPLDHDDAQVVINALGDGIPLLRAFRVEAQPDSRELAVCRFTGDFMPTEEGAAGNEMGFEAVGGAGRFDGYQIGEPDLPFVRDLSDVGDTMADVLAEMNSEVDTGIELGLVEPSVFLDVSYDGKRGGEVFAELAGTQGGPDFEVIPLADEDGQGTQIGRLEIYARQGIDRPNAVFGYGDGTVGNCTDATRQWLKPRNRVIVTGAEGLRAVVEDPDSIVTYGLWTHTEAMSDVIDQPVLDARADELLRPYPIRYVSLEPDPNARDEKTGEPITPVPGVDYWLGDTVRGQVRKGAFQHDGAIRVDAIGIALDDAGNESKHTVEYVQEGAVA